MHIWDTFRIALHLDGFAMRSFIFGKFLKHLVGCQRIFLPTAAQKKLEIHKVFLRFFCLHWSKISRCHLDNLLLRTCL